jgi:hydroxymethylglutaryl-CoA reductase (NADPH)
MPISTERAREITERMMAGETIESLQERLAPVPPSEKPLPPALPSPYDWSAGAMAARRARLAEGGAQTPHLGGEAAFPDPASLQGNIEQYVGMTWIPTGVIGPLRVNGLHCQDDVFVPLATSEGALVASYDRGARVMSAAGGVTCLTTAQHVQRAPAFAFRTVLGAAHFATWAVGQVERFREVAATRTRHGRLLEMSTHLQGNLVYLIFAYHTGDAAGQNMVTFCTAAICDEILSTTPVAPEYWFLESNMSGDKKATALSFMQTRGRNVLSEVILPRALVTERLHTSPERMCDYWRVSFVGGVQTGSIGVSGHIANGLAALFMACGQDVACVAEASVGLTRMELTAGGDLYCSLSLPNVIVGTVGGGTNLPTARECLRMMGCEGEGSAARLAEICAAVALGGEISIVAALCSGDFAQAHARLGRKRGGA